MRRSASRCSAARPRTRPTTTTATGRTAAPKSQYSWLGPKPGVRVDYDIAANAGAALQDARGAGGRHRPGDARHRSGLRHLRELCVRRRRRIRRSQARPTRPRISNFRLKPGSKAVDAGVRLPNVNDGFSRPRAGSRRLRSGTAGAGLRTAMAEGAAVLSVGQINCLPLPR